MAGLLVTLVGYRMAPSSVRQARARMSIAQSGSGSWCRDDRSAHGSVLFLEEDGDFRGAEDNPSLFYRWVPLPELATLELYPEVLRDAADGFPAFTERVVVRTA